MTQYTKTEEIQFSDAVEHANSSIAQQTAESRMKQRAEKQGYLYMVAETFVIVTKMDLVGRYRAEASATFAKVVVLDKSQRNTDVEPEDEKSDDTPYAAPPAPLEW